jgi:hypothetical protein
MKELLIFNSMEEYNKFEILQKTILQIPFRHRNQKTEKLEKNKTGTEAYSRPLQHPSPKDNRIITWIDIRGIKIKQTTITKDTAISQGWFNDDGVV